MSSANPGDRAMGRRRSAIGRGATPAGGFALLVLALLTVLAWRRGGELELHVVLPEEPTIQGKPILLAISVENVSGRRVRLSGWEPVDPEQCRILEAKPFDIRLFYDRSPQPMLHVPYGLGLPGVAPLELAPGEAATLECDIALLFGLARPGTYRLEVTYVRDPWARHPALRLPARLGSSALVHEPVEFEIAPRFR